MIIIKNTHLGEFSAKSKSSGNGVPAVNCELSTSTDIFLEKIVNMCL